MTGPCNLGNPHEVSIGQIPDLIVELTRSSSPITYQPLPQEDPRRRRPAIERSEASWLAPRVSLENGLKATIRYFTLKLFGQESPSIAPISYHPMPWEQKRARPATNAGFAPVPSQDESILRLLDPAGSGVGPATHTLAGAWRHRRLALTQLKQLASLTGNFVGRRPKNANRINDA
jgi:hypothetical protein